MKFPGIPKPTIKSQVAGLSNMIKIARASTIAKPKKRKTYIRKKIKNDMFEKRLEEKIILCLNLKRHIIAWKVGETSTYNAQYTINGIADIEGFNFKTLKKFYIEVKRPGGAWRDSQIAFMGLCDQMDIEYILAFTFEEAMRNFI